jgi:DNA-binding NarL/FixJ family response regulator
MANIHVLLVDDQSGVCAGLKMRLALEPDITVVGEASDGEGALAAAAIRQPDVVVMDYEMPGMNGAEATEALQRSGSHAAVVMLSLHDDVSVRAEAARAGVTAFVAKHEPSESLIAAIRGAAAQLQGAI